MKELATLAGRRALITGARQGIGRAVATALAEAGVHVCVTARERASLDPILSQLPGEHLGIVMEARKEDSIRSAVATAVDGLGGLDILVNNAAIPCRSSATKCSSKEWDAVLNVNLRAPFLVSREAHHALMASDQGRIVNMSSTYAVVAVPNRAAYAASKAGLEQLTRALAVEWAADGITVNAVAPTTTLTEQRRRVFQDPDRRARRIAEIPLGRFGTARDLTGVVLMLCSSAGAFITGTTIPVDGGYTLRVRRS